MNATTKTGFEPALAKALAKHLCEKAPFKFYGPRQIQELLEAGCGALLFGGDHKRITALAVYLDSNGETKVLSGNSVTAVESHIGLLQGPNTLLQPNGDWILIHPSGTSATYATAVGNDRSTVYFIEEATDLGFSDFVAGFNAGRNST